MNNTIQYAVDQDGIALLTIDLPDMPMNVLTPELMEDLATLTARAAADASCQRHRFDFGQESLHRRCRHQGHGHRLRPGHHSQGSR